jgi:hypothetical protein
MTRPVDRFPIFPAIFGITRTAAIRNEVCVLCKRSVADLRANGPWSDGDEAEFRISGTCPACFDAATKERGE